MTTSVPGIQFADAGLVLPVAADVLGGVRADIDKAFGGGLNPAPETPQGQIASSLAAIIDDKNSEFAGIVNQIDPDKASGRMQDAIGRIYFIDRKPAAPTAVVATCTGLAGVVIPVGAQAKAADGNRYLCTQAGTIPLSGNIDLNFACAVTGPVACPPGTLNQIYQTIPGWDAINNANAGTVGSDVESRAAFEDRRRQSVALNAINSLQSIYASVLQVPNVLDAYATENVTDAPITTGGVTLAPHSVYIAVVGGDAEAIAKAIWRKKSLGANYNGNTSYTVTDDAGYSFPQPSYVVKWETPGALPIKFAVQIARNPSLPSDIVAQVQRAIVGAFNGGDGGERASIGATLFASRFYGPVTKIGTMASVLSLLLGPDTPTLASFTVPINNTPTIDVSNIDVKLV
ncbi:MAG: baseplate J/gp47 family protein [Burkholderia gladioli]